MYNVRIRSSIHTYVCAYVVLQCETLRIWASLHLSVYTFEVTGIGWNSRFTQESRLFQESMHICVKHFNRGCVHRIHRTVPPQLALH